ncbi:hypothetical protein [Litoribaculum gwangyangense]|uniref:Polysaccharide chain length determinant N-terminal domain-containing protein n=1 Tax=Litoribaculum gwangyangense TaxID=1130722 RepID=A0ABP9C0N7_9FLAO
MSKDLQQPKQSEEVDLGQLFKLIGNAFERLFKFIGSIFYKLFLAFVWFVFFIKKHIIKFVVAGVLGIALGVFLEKNSEPTYKSYVTIKQNYETGENLYNSISYYNDLVQQKDYATLKNVLGFTGSEASSILSFSIESVISENEKLQAFDKYIKTLDSVAASKIEYETFLKNNKDYTHTYQQITIKALVRSNFKSVFDNIVGNLETNPFFVSEQKKDLSELISKEIALKEALAQSDSLKNTYKKVLEKDLKNNGSEIGITFEGNTEKNKTKEFDLYLNDLELRRELVEIERQKADKERIVEIISSKQDSGTVDNRIEFLSLELSPKVFYVILIILITMIVLMTIDFLKFLERFKDKI